MIRQILQNALLIFVGIFLCKNFLHMIRYTPLGFIYADEGVKKWKTGRAWTGLLGLILFPFLHYWAISHIFHSQMEAIITTSFLIVVGCGWELMSHYIGGAYSPFLNNVQRLDDYIRTKVGMKFYLESLPETGSPSVLVAVCDQVNVKSFLKICKAYQALTWAARKHPHALDNGNHSQRGYRIEFGWIPKRQIE